MEPLKQLKPESEHLLHLDALRLIASAGIVILHLSIEVDPGHPVEDEANVLRPLNMFVDMFFLISGFVIAYVYASRISSIRAYRIFIQKRLARLAPLHWLTLLIFLLIGIGANAIHARINHNETFDSHCLLANFFFLHATGLCSHLSFNGPSWSISAEMLMYLAAPILFWLAKKSSLLMGVSGALIALVLNHETDGNWLYWTADGGAIRALPSFMVGIFLFTIRSRIAQMPFANVGFWLGIGGFIAGLIFGATGMPLLLVLVAAVVCGIASDLKGNPTRLVRMLAAGGQLTYSVYMWHRLIILVLVTIVANRLLHLHGVGKNIAVVFAFLAVWPIGYLSLFAFERPAREWIGAHYGSRRSSLVIK